MAHNIEEKGLEKAIESKNWKSKILDWIKRYGPAEIIATITAYLGYYLIWLITGNPIASAYGGTIGENTGFYGLLISREIIQDSRKAKNVHGKYLLMD